MSTPTVPRDPGLFEMTGDDGDRSVTNIRKIAGSEAPPGRGLVSAAAVLLGLLDLGLFAVSLAAQYQYIFRAKHDSWPAVIEAVALDAGMIIFSLLALGLARGGQSARTERALILACAFGSAAMNYAAADVSSARSVAAYVMPPVFLAIVTDRVIAVVRRHVLGMDAERSAWAVLGRAVLAVLAAAGKAILYGLRLVLAPRSTCGGARRLVLLATPLPAAPALALPPPPEAEEAEAAADRAALGEDLRELREQHESTAANLGDSLRGAQEAFRTEIEAVREAVRTETGAVRDTLRTQTETVREAARAEIPDAVRAALGPVRGAVGEDLRELRKQHDSTAANLVDSLRATHKAFRGELETVRETLRTEIDAVRDAARTQAPGPAEEEPPAVDRDAVVAELADQVRDAIRSGERWTPAYAELMTRTRYSRSWCEKAARDARTQAFAEPRLWSLGQSTDPPRRAESTTDAPSPSPANPEETS